MDGVWRDGHSGAIHVASPLGSGGEVALAGSPGCPQSYRDVLCHTLAARDPSGLRVTASSSEAWAGPGRGTLSLTHVCLSPAV